ncbi:hypothetical protein ACN4EG_21155 [Alkalinema pantanalense CENA528]|uniref:hypothetical protein n=1 Tax=Alkalinema pantanalense TaxID=1620705 RepID=UPI003D6DF011
MNLRKSALILSAIGVAIGPLASAVQVNAQPTGFTNHKDDKGNIYVGGANNGEVTIAITDAPKTKSLSVNACGVAIWRNSSTAAVPDSFTVNGSTINKASLPSALLPKCLATGQLEESRSSNFITPDGAVVLVGLTPSSSVKADYLAAVNKVVKTNACGFGKLSNSTTKPFTASQTFDLGSGPVSFSSIPTAPAWLCRDNITYKPIVSSGS